MASRSPSRVLAPIDANTTLRNEPAADPLAKKLPGMASLQVSGAETKVPLPVLPTTAKPAAKTQPTTSAKKKPAAAPKPKPAASRKRKSDAIEDTTHEAPQHIPEIDDEDPRLARTDKDTCNLVRRRIRDWIGSGAMKVGEFQKAIGVSSKGYGNFMNRTKTWDGEGCDTFRAAHVFFKRRELQGLPLKKIVPKVKQTGTDKKAAKEKAETLLDVSGVSLEGEESRRVPVYDTCDELRKKLRAFLAKDGITNAAFVREINKTFTTEDCETLGNAAPNTLARFLGLKGPLAGNTTDVFYAAYVFFEKRRVKDGAPKSAFRLEMEKVHGRKGLDVKNNSNTGYFCMAGETVTMDKYGSVDIVRSMRGPSRAKWT